VVSFILDEILGLSCVTRRLKIVSTCPDQEEESELLGTIKLTPDISILASRLPGPNYKDDFKYNLSEPSPARSAYALPKISLQEKLKTKDTSLRIDQSLSRITIQRKSTDSQGNSSSIRSHSQNPVNKSYRDILKDNYGALKLPQLKVNSSASKYNLAGRKSTLRRDASPSHSPEIDGHSGHDNSYSINSASRQSALIKVTSNSKASKAYLKQKWWAV
jgi:hypothetical protein